MSKQVRSPLPAEIRLAQSRERIRLWLTPPEDEDTDDEASSGSALPEQLQAWMRELREHPIFSSTFNALHGWWESHPWRPATHLAGGLFKEALQPLATKHPLGLVLVAAAIGGSLVWFRPGRGLVKSLLLKGVVSQSVLGLAKQPFVGTLANSVISWMHQLSTPRERSPS